MNAGTNPGVIRNNLIVNNAVYQAESNTFTFGGGGIWVLGSGTTTIIENNTIVANSSQGEGSEVAGKGGGILIWNTPAVIRNNIIWGNTQLFGGQILLNATTTEIGYNNIGGNGTSGTNIDADPLFCNPDSGDYSLAENSPCAGTGLNGIDMGAFEVDCGPKMVAKDIKSSVIYGANGTDEITITAEITNPLNHALLSLALIKSDGDTLLDSLSLYDDGTHNDSTAGDGQWGGIWIVNNTETLYSAHVYMQDTEDNLEYTSYDSTIFTTIGPVAFENYGTPYSTDPPRPGDDVYFSLTLINHGTVVTAANVAVLATVAEDSCVSLFWDPLFEYGDIPAGETATSISTYWLRISETCPGDINLSVYLKISSNDIFFWSDTFDFYVYEPLGLGSEYYPKDFTLAQNYPNPFNPTTTIEYHLPQEIPVTVTVYNLAGQTIKELVKNTQPAGTYQVNFNASALASGIYFYRIETPTLSQSRKMVLIK